MKGKLLMIALMLVSLQAIGAEMDFDQLVGKIFEGTEGQALLTQAIINNDVKSVRELIDTGTAQINGRFKGKTPLMWAAVRCKPDVIDFLVQKGANHNLVDQTGRTALDMARESLLSVTS